MSEADLVEILGKLLRGVIVVGYCVVSGGIIYLWLCLVRFLVAGEKWFEMKSDGTAPHTDDSGSPVGNPRREGGTE